MQNHLSPKLKFAVAFLVLASCTAASATEPVMNVIARNLKSRYNASEVHIPFMFLARFAVATVRPAGVRSVKVKLFQHLNYELSASGREFNAFIQDALGREWQPMVRVFSRPDHQETYIYAKEEGKDLHVMVVNISNEDATLVDCRVNPNSLEKFLNDPKILGISVN